MIDFRDTHKGKIKKIYEIYPFLIIYYININKIPLPILFKVWDGLDIGGVTLIKYKGERYTMIGIDYDIMEVNPNKIEDYLEYVERLLVEAI